MREGGKVNIERVRGESEESKESVRKIIILKKKNANIHIHRDHSTHWRREWNHR